MVRSRTNRAGKLPPEREIEQLPSGRCYVVVAPLGDGRLVVYVRVSSGGQKDGWTRLIISGAGWPTWNIASSYWARKSRRDSSVFVSVPGACGVGSLSW